MNIKLIPSSFSSFLPVITNVKNINPTTNIKIEDIAKVRSWTLIGLISATTPRIKVELTTTQKDKAVMGVWDSNNPSGSHNDKYLDQTLPRINYNAVGEGMIRVTDTGGNIETGDFICSSNRTGHGEKQDDDLMHNYTVAKATQPYNFTSASNDADLGYKSVLIACTYHCG